LNSEIPPSNSDWSALTSYQDLSAPYLLARQEAPRRVTLKFTSPTCFKSKGMHVPIPTPELVFGSLLERWNTFAPVVFPPETRRYAAECLAVSRYNLSSRPVPVKSRGMRVGGLGEITYTSLVYDRYWMSVVQTLAAFALFSGVGAGTAHGLGQCRSWAS
jgi:CRISPR-associated endoribonuclease Cas6